MPIKVPNNLPAVDTLTKENVFVMTDARAMTQDIRPLHILLLNLMPTKIDTETQLTRLLGNTPLQIELELLQTGTHKSKNTSREHMLAFYKTFGSVKDNYYDGMIITGAPIELMEFEEVEYWDELCEIMEWSKTHVHSTLHICWGAQAGLYYHYGIKKHIMPEKLSGVFEHRLDYKKGMLFRGFDDAFFVPHSRNTTVFREEIEENPDLKILASGEKPGLFAVKSEKYRQIFIMGHSEYDWDTLLKEYFRDKKAGLNPKVPENYFPNDDDSQTPIVRWRSCANLLFSNWLNYFVYQSTPYDISTISREDLSQPEVPEEAKLKVAKFGGTSVATAAQLRKVKKIVEEDPARKFVVVSAPGKRNPQDAKVTDLLINAADNPEKFDENIEQVAARFKEIVRELGMTAGGDTPAGNDGDTVTGNNGGNDGDTAIGNDGDAVIGNDGGIEHGADTGIDIDAEIRLITKIFKDGTKTFKDGENSNSKSLERAADKSMRNFLISRGEYLSGKIIAEMLNYDLIEPAGVIIFDGKGRLEPEKTAENMKAALKAHERAVIPGFYGSDEEGNIVTFSRGGSDMTGSLVAAAALADLYENWTDVDGVLLADPLVVNNPLTVPLITYKEVRELSAMGTEVVHEDVIFPVQKLGIPINIKNTDKPETPGTLIVKSDDNMDSVLKISGISGGKGYAGFLIEKDKLSEEPELRTKVMDIFSLCGISIVNMVSGIDSLDVFVSEKDVRGKIRELTARIKALSGADRVTVKTDLAIVAVVSRHMGRSLAIGAKVLTSLSDKNVNVKMLDYGVEGISTLIGVDAGNYEKAVRAIYGEFIKK